VVSGQLPVVSTLFSQVRSGLGIKALATGN